MKRICVDESFPFVFTVSVADCHQRVRAIQSHAPYLRELRISPVNTLVEIINGQPCGKMKVRDSFT